MRNRSIVLASAVIAFTWGCAGNPVNQPAPLSPAGQAMNVTQGAGAMAPEKALLTAPEKALANPEKALVQAPALSASTNLTANVKADLQDFVSVDSELDNTELLSRLDRGGFATQGWFKDMKDKIQAKWEAHKLKKEAKKQLKDNDEIKAEREKSALDKLKKDRSNQDTTTTQLPDGGKEVTTSWQDNKHKSTVVKQVYDAEGTLQSTTLTQKGTDDGQSFELIRSRTLKDDNGTYEVYTKRTQTLKDGRTKVTEWTKVVTPDGHETISGTITNPDGKVIKIAGTKSPDGKVNVDKATEEK